MMSHTKPETVVKYSVRTAIFFLTVEILSIFMHFITGATSHTLQVASVDVFQTRLRIHSFSRRYCIILMSSAECFWPPNSVNCTSYVVYTLIMFYIY